MSRCCPKNQSLCEEATAERPSGKAGEDTDAAMEDADTAREDTAREDADTAPPLYHIKRAVYSEDLLQSQLLHCRHRRPVSLPQKLAQTFRCSSERAKAVALGCLPVLTWLPSYPVREYLFDDVVSGLSTGVVQLPQGLAYAMLAAVPAVYGLYSSFYPVFLYTFFGTSRHISIGTFAVMSLMIGGVVVREAPDAMFPLQAANGTNMSVTVDVDARDARRVQVAVALTTLVGLIQLLFGLLRFGFVAIYLTEPLVRGFTTAAAVHVFISQLKYLLGVKTRRFSGPLAAVYSFVAAMSDIANTNIVTLLVGLICMAFLYAVKDCNERFKKKLPVPIPGEIIVVIVSTASSYGLGLSDNYKVDVVGNIPSGLLPPAVPHFHLLPNLIADSFAIAIVGFSMAISMAKTFALKHGYNVDGNQELMALGLCNFVSSFFQTFAISCSMSRSLVQESTGGKTQIAGLLASLLVLLVVVAIGFMFQPLPQTVLAAIIMVNLLGMFKQTLDIPVLWRSSKIELAIWLVSFVASVLLGLDYGLMVALTFAILTVIYRTQSPRTTLLGQIPGTGLYCDMDQYEGAVDVSGIKIFQSNSSIYFANTDLYVNSLRDKTGVNPAKLQAEWKAKEKLKKKENEVLCPPAESSCTGPEVTELLSWNQEAELKNGQATAPVPVHTIILDWTPVNFMDTVGAKAIKSVIKEYEAVDVRVLIAGCSRTLLSELETLQFFSTSVTPAMVFPTVHDAVLRSQHQRDLACSHQ